MRSLHIDNCDGEVELFVLNSFIFLIDLFFPFTFYLSAKD
ncbi:hypothetical protein HMPREF3218_0200668 [Prevotella bivia]|nr:hypothetical protein HMPREF3218_0200668 [Prevotella bivia]